MDRLKKISSLKPSRIRERWKSRAEKKQDATVQPETGATPDPTPEEIPKTSPSPVVEEIERTPDTSQNPPLRQATHASIGPRDLNFEIDFNLEMGPPVQVEASETSIVKVGTTSTVETDQELSPRPGPNSIASSTPFTSPAPRATSLVVASREPRTEKKKDIIISYTRRQRTPVRGLGPPPLRERFFNDRIIILRIVDFLEYAGTVSFKLSSKKLYRAIPMPETLPTAAEKLALLRLLPPARPFLGDRGSPHLCSDCLMWHSPEHLVIFPNPIPESQFASYWEFRTHSGQVCARFAQRSGRWVPGAQIEGSRYVLCAICRTPRGYDTGECAWNCVVCRKCVGREKWSSQCRECLAPDDWYSTTRRMRAPASSVGTGLGYGLGKTGDFGNRTAPRVCMRCLGTLGDVLSKERCVC